MVDLLGDVILERPATAFKANPPRPATCWYVWTWYAPHNEWKLHRIQWSSKEAAEREAQLLRKQRGHTHYCVLRVELPGVFDEPGQAA